MEFHIWDFSDRIEFGVSQQLIDKLKTYTKPVTTTFIHYRSKSKTPTTVTRRYWIFPEANPIGKRLFSKWDFHCRRGKKTKHYPFLKMTHLEEIHEKTGITLEELEKAVTHVRVGSGTGVRLKMTFPVVANEDWAFLFGLWFGAGGYISRCRDGNAEEMTLRFAVDPRPYRELLAPLLMKLGYETAPKYVYRWYVKHGGHKLDAHVWRQYGSEPRGCVFLHRPIREIMEKFGLPDAKACKSKRKTKGGKSSFRMFDRKIPKWIISNIKYSHAFIEGYLNGQSTASQFHPSYPRKPVSPLTRFVEPRFIGKKDIALPFYRWFSRFMAENEGIQGYEHHLPPKRKDQTNIELGFLIINNIGLRKLYEQFRIMRADTRARLILHYYLNPLMYEMCRKLECFETLLLGAIMENPQSVEELTRDFRCSKAEVIKTLNRLYRDFKAITPTEDSKWKIQNGFRNVILAELHAQEEERRRKIQWASARFFSQCDKCGDIAEKNHIGHPCRHVDCRGKYYPISRPEYMSKRHLRNSQIAARIYRVSKSKLPSFSAG